MPSWEVSSKKPLAKSKRELEKVSSFTLDTLTLSHVSLVH